MRDLELLACKRVVGRRRLGQNGAVGSVLSLRDLLPDLLRSDPRGGHAQPLVQVRPTLKRPVVHVVDLHVLDVGESHREARVGHVVHDVLSDPVPRDHEAVDHYAVQRQEVRSATLLLPLTGQGRDGGVVVGDRLRAGGPLLFRDVPACQARDQHGTGERDPQLPALGGDRAVAGQQRADRQGHVVDPSAPCWGHGEPLPARPRDAHYSSLLLFGHGSSLQQSDVTYGTVGR